MKDYQEEQQMSRQTWLAQEEGRSRGEGTLERVTLEFTCSLNGVEKGGHLLCGNPVMLLAFLWQENGAGCPRCIVLE